MADASRTTDQDRTIRDTAMRESWPYTDPRANYPTAEQHRQNRADGAERRAA